MIRMRYSPEPVMVSISRRCSAPAAVSRRRSAVPSTPLSGVRISWLIVARKAACDRAAASAMRRASASSTSRAFCVEMSRSTLT